MENLALNLSKALTDLVEHQEKRFVDQKQNHDTQTNLLESLQARIESVEKQCQELNDDNAALKSRLKATEKQREEIAKESTQAKSSVEKLEARLVEFEGWVKLIAAIASQINCLNESRDQSEEKLKGLLHNQNEILKQLGRHKQQLSSLNSYRTTIKSPSPSTFLSNNIHGSIPRSKTSNFHRDTYLLQSLDVKDDIVEMSDQAEELKRGVEVLNDLQRSFEKSSIYSED